MAFTFRLSILFVPISKFCIVLRGIPVAVDRYFWVCCSFILFACNFVCNVLSSYYLYIRVSIKHTFNAIIGGIMRIFYHKIMRFSISILCFVLSFCLFVNTASAASSSLNYNSLFGIQVHNFHNATTTDVLDSVYYGAGTLSVVNFDCSFTASFFKEAYSSSLYANGYLRANIDIPLRVPVGLTTGGISYDVTFSRSDDSLYMVVPYVTYVSSTNTIQAQLHCYLSNNYLVSAKDHFASCTFNVSVSFFLPVDYVSASLMLDMDNPVIRSGGFNVSTSVRPVTTNGLAGVISDSVIAGIMDSSVDDLLVSANSQLNSANTNLSTTISVLNSIKEQDNLLYNKIIESIVLQTENDTALQQAFIQYLSAQLRGQSSIYDPYSGSGQFVFVDSPIGDIAARIWQELTNFRIIFTDYIYSNQSEAADVNSEAASQESALSDLQESLVVPTPVVDGVLDDLASDFLDSEIESGQFNVFYFLRHSYIVKIVAFSFSLGLIGFILYGKG